MSDLRKAAEFALEAMEKYCECGGLEDPIEELRQALAQPEWVGLTDEEIEEYKWMGQDVIAVIKEVQTTLKEKNT